MPTVDFDLVPIRGKFRGIAGTVINGPIIFTPDIPWTHDPDATTGSIILSEQIVGQVVSGELKAADGVSTLYLYATDDPDIYPSSWTYTVVERFADIKNRPAYHIKVPLADKANGIDITAVPADLPPAAPGTKWLLASGAGTLDAGTLSTYTPPTATYDAGVYESSVYSA